MIQTNPEIIEMVTRKKLNRQRKYFAPQNENHTHKCDHLGCQEEGEFRAPKDRNLKEYYWFCLKHVQAYNAKWNYYEGLDDKAQEEEAAQSRRRFKFSSKVKYNFGFDFSSNFEFFDNYELDYASMNRPFYNQEDKKCLIVMELSSEGLCLDVLKKQYKKLVKKYHPDLNQDDKEAEEKFKILSQAYNTLLQKLS